MGKEVGNVVVVIVAADQLEDEVGLHQEDGEQDHNCCEAQKSKQDKKTFFPKEDLPGNFLLSRSSWLNCALRGDLLCTGSV